MDTGPHNVKMTQWIACAPFEKLLNLEILSAESGKATLKMPFLYEYAQGAGLLHGGALITLADTAVVMAIKSLLEEGTHFATTKINANFLYPVKKGFVVAHAIVTKGEEERVYIGKAELFNDENIKVLDFDAIFKVARKRKNFKS